MNRDIYGYIIVDSVKAILSLSGMDFQRFFGSTTKRVAIFTNMTHGCPPMVAVRVHTLKPRMMVIHGPSKPGSLAIQLAKAEHIQLVISKAVYVSDVVRLLHGFRYSIFSKQVRENHF